MRFLCAESLALLSPGVRDRLQHPCYHVARARQRFRNIRKQTHAFHVLRLLFNPPLKLLPRLGANKDVGPAFSLRVEFHFDARPEILHSQGTLFGIEHPSWNISLRERLD